MRVVDDVCFITAPSTPVGWSFVLWTVGGCIALVVDTGGKQEAQITYKYEHKERMVLHRLTNGSHNVQLPQMAPKQD